MTPFEIDDEGRAAYHAAASVASNFLVTLQAAAETIAAGAGLERREARALLGSARAPDGGEHRRAGTRGGAHRPGGPRRRGNRRERSGRPSRRWRRSCSTCSTSWCAGRASSPPRGRPHEDGPHGCRAARAARPRAPRRARDRAGADDGLLPRRPPVADAARARRERGGGRLAVREPRPVRARRGLRRLPARRAARHRAGRGRGRGHPVLAAGRGGLPGRASTRRSSSAASPRRSRATRPSAARSTSRA